MCVSNIDLRKTANVFTAVARCAQRRDTPVNLDETDPRVSLETRIERRVQQGERQALPVLPTTTLLSVCSTFQQYLNGPQVLVPDLAC